MKIFVILASIFVFVNFVEAKQLVEQDIQKHIIGRTIYLQTPFGGEFPLNYRKGGSLDGDGNAIGLGRFFKPKDKGRWWIKDNQLCQQWQSWYNGEAYCFVLKKTSPTSLEWLRNDGLSGLARIE